MSGGKKPQPWEGFAFSFSKGTNVALVGSKGSGKSWTASYYSQMALDRNDYVVASNILCQRWLLAEDDPTSGTWEEAYPDGYKKVNTYYNLFWVIYSALREGKTVLFVLDEAGALAKGMQAGETAMQERVRENNSFMQVARHLNVCTLIITQSLERVQSAMRTQEGGILDRVITKPSTTHKEIAIVENDDGESEFITIPAYKIANKKEWAQKRPGRIIYADALSSFEHGFYPGTHITFRLRGVLDGLSDQLPDRYPDIIREHLEWRPLPAKSKAEPVAAPSDERGIGGAAPNRGVGPDVEQAVLDGRSTKHIMDTYGVSGGTVTYYRRKLKRVTQGP